MPTMREIYSQHNVLRFHFMFIPNFGTLVKIWGNENEIWILMGVLPESSHMHKNMAWNYLKYLSFFIIDGFNNLWFQNI